MTMHQAIPILDHIAETAAPYDAWLCDIWGVIHNGVEAFPGAVDACRKFRARGGVVALITNAPRPAAFVGALLDAMNITGIHDAIVSSGDVTMTLLGQRAGQRVFHLGPERDKPILDGLDLNRAKPEEADFILNSGPFFDEHETPDDYRALFETLLARRVPMLCANPDLMVERGGALIYCAGALAQAYERMGGEVVYAGKPYAPIYELAISKIAAARGAELDRAKILAIGDGVNTDIKGAADFGLKSVFVASAVHVKGGDMALTPEALAALFADKPFAPAAAQAKLRW